MKLVTAAEMQGIDRRTIEGGLVPSLDLMENAGRAAACEALGMLHDVAKARVEILCGKGNNGGDGFVVARHLAAQGARVRVHRTHPAASCSPDARAHYAQLSGTRVEDVDIPEQPDDAWARCLRDADLCVDALLGTGVERRLSGRLAALVDQVNAAGRPTLAIDVPTGIDATTGAVLGAAVRARCTVTFGLPKRGLVLYPGRAYTGRLVVAEIGFPSTTIDAVETLWSWTDQAQARAWLPRLDPTAHKYARGTVLVIAGSRTYPGAAALAAEAAQRSGAGMVHLVSVESNRTILESRLREVIVHAVPETAQGTCDPTAFDTLTRLVARADAVALGPGLGTASETLDGVRQFLAQLDKPAVVDADGLRALPPAPRAAPRVLTPHAGELARLADLHTADVGDARDEIAVDVARRYAAVVLAKGAPTIVVEPSGARHVNSTGNVGLATGGTGDVLTGIVGAFLAQGLEPARAAALAAYVHGVAADALAACGSARSLVAGDLPGALGGVFRALEST